jgi:4-hydroxy-tetrahydrodipicolinate reductase
MLLLCFEQVKQQYPNLVMVDYTLPDVIHDMANLYIKHKTPFVMGVSG